MIHLKSNSFIKKGRCIMALLSKKSNTLKFKTPAGAFGGMWREGLFTGSGRVGAAVLGGAGFDTVIINHGDLWHEGATGVLPDVSDKVRSVKSALEKASYSEAESILSKALTAKSYSPKLSCPLPLCDLKVTQPICDIKDYERSVNLENGEVTVKFKDGGTKFERALFVSRANDIVFYEITKSGAKPIDITFNLVPHSTCCGGLDANAQFDAKSERGYMYFALRNEDGTDYGAVARVIASGGTLNLAGDGINIAGANEVFVMLKTFVAGQKENAYNDIKTELSAIKTPYDKLLKEHTNLHNKLFSAVDFTLYYKNKEEYIEDLTDKTLNGALPPELTEKLYAYGRYLFICSSSAGGRPCYPYGLFCGDYNAAESTRNNYLQTQRIYNFALNGNLLQLFAPLFKKYADNLDDYKKNATRLFNCAGIYVPALEAPMSGLLGSVEPEIVLNFNVAAIISQMIYDVYNRTDDSKMLKEFGLEFIEETARFYEELFKVNKTTNTFESPLGYSPYNTPVNMLTKNRDKLCIASNCTVDFVCAKQVFGILAELTKKGVIKEEEGAKYTELLEKIPHITVDTDGTIKEYLSNVFETNNKMPHIPHLFPFNVGALPLDSKREYEKLVINTAKTRFNSPKNLFTAGSIVNIATALSTAGDGSSSFDVLSRLTQSFLTRNLILVNTDYKGMGIGKNEPQAVFSIDKNTAFCNAIQNMFINSNADEVTLFKNLPEQFNKGYIAGLVLNNGIKADVDFNRRRGSLKVKLRPGKNIKVALNLPEGTKKVKGFTPEQLDLENLKIKELNLEAGKTTAVNIKWSNKI